jgi:RimJ/RimL family protein N-acetyltransferase
MPSFPDLAEPLCDGVAALRLASERDIPEILIAYQDDPGLHALMGEERPPSAAELGRLAERMDADRTAGRGLTLTILEPGSDACRGQLHVEQVDWGNRRAELGIWLAPQLRGRGMGRRALRLAGAWLLRGCGFERLQTLSEAGNQAMIAAARAAGFVEEGVLRGYMRRGARRIDTIILSLLLGDLET